ncbi:uncharacterized protein LOC135350079 [Halichondria panicea]|uniref:uncharacterized protein LOC135350079 n=1 Tax=Halichondria panicea TaxID=6063 RepID=UPI00312BB25D
MDEELLKLADHLNEISQKLLTICEAAGQAAHPQRLKCCVCPHTSPQRKSTTPTHSDTCDQPTGYHFIHGREVVLADCNYGYTAVLMLRYYVAEGVRLYSQETWRVVTQTRGVQLVEQHIHKMFHSPT